MYKPGQIITINKVKYRIMRTIFSCISCDYRDIESYEYPCKKCPITCERMKLVKLCGNQDN